MNTLTVTTENIKLLDDSIVTIGNFDGVHRGHGEIFAHLQRTSIARGMSSVVVTFEPHPLKVLAPAQAPLLLTTFQQKQRFIQEYDIDYLIVMPFNAAFSRLSAADFVTDILCNCLSMRHIIIGHDYAFGRNREGNFQTLELLGEHLGFTLEDVPPIGSNGSVFSSSLARQKVADGDMSGAAGVLGRYFQIVGKVVHGREIGHTLGFPTANISTENELLPPDGVYAVMVDIDGTSIKGACNIGFNPTVQGTSRTVEVFLLDFNRDIYGSQVTISFVERLRSVQKFASLKELTEAIKRDVATTRMILETI